MPWLSISVLLGASLIAWLTAALGDPTAAWWIMIAGFLLVLAYHLRNLYRLLAWFRMPSIENLPDSVGAWGEVFTALYHRERLLARSQQRLENALDRFQSAANAIPDGIVVLDQHERIEWMNPSARRFLNLDEEKDTGQLLCHLVRNPAFVEWLEQHNASGLLEFRPTHNPDLHLGTQAIPFENGRRMLVVRDITEQERTTQMRRDFVANVSHELRTPLTVVGGFLETMDDMDDLDAEVLRRYLPMMLEQTTRMRRLIDDLLTLSRLETAGALAPQEAVNVPRLMEVLKCEAESLSHGKHRIVMQCHSERWLHGSEHELHSAFGNLVSNAVRYTPEGGTITLNWQENGKTASFAVEDTGLGIAPEHLPRLTERFYRVDRGRSRDTGGTGLGLAIVKHILMRHEAELSVSSQLGQGSRFACVFRKERLQAPAHPA